MNKHYSIIIVSLLFVIFGHNCQNQPRKFTETRFQMGTVVQITLFETSKKSAQRQMDNGFAEIDRIAALFWEGNPDSDIYKINHRKSDTIHVRSEVAQLLARAKHISQQTDGAFDMTIGTLKELYNFEKKIIPDTNQIKAVLNHIGFENLSIDTTRNRLRFKNPDFKLITGAIVKGYAADRAIDIIKKENPYGVLVNAGGDIRVTKRHDSKKWIVGVQDPKEKGHLIGKVAIYEGAVVTSGDYEQYTIIEGKRYHHILNPLTGFSAEKSHATTVIAPKAECADAIATGLFVLGDKRGKVIINRFPCVEALWIDWEGNSILTDGFSKYLVGDLETNH